MKTREEDVNTTSPSDLSTMNFKDLFGPKRVCTGLKKTLTMPEKSSERNRFNVVIIYLVYFIYPIGRGASYNKQSAVYYIPPRRTAIFFLFLPSQENKHYNEQLYRHKLFLI